MVCIRSWFSALSCWQSPERKRSTRTWAISGSDRSDSRGSGSCFRVSFSIISVRVRLILDNPEAAANPFYLLAPRPLLYPLIALATMAAIIASQAMISGAFSLTRQCVQLGYSPRVTIVHTSKQEHGQIYIPEVNNALLIGCLLVVLYFGSIDRAWAPLTE